jgi:hypothetical protein
MSNNETFTLLLLWRLLFNDLAVQLTTSHCCHTFRPFPITIIGLIQSVFFMFAAAVAERT